MSDIYFSSKGGGRVRVLKADNGGHGQASLGVSVLAVDSPRVQPAVALVAEFPVPACM